MSSIVTARSLHGRSRANRVPTSHTELGAPNPAIEFGKTLGGVASVRHLGRSNEAQASS